MGFERGGFGCRDAAVSRRRVSGTLRVGAGAIADEPRGERVHQRGLDLHAQGDLLSRRAPHAAARRGPGGRHPSSSRARRHRACARDGDVQRRRRHGSRDGAMPPNRTRGSFARRSSLRPRACATATARLRLVEEKRKRARRKKADDPDVAAGRKKLRRDQKKGLPVTAVARRYLDILPDSVDRALDRPNR